MFDLQIDGRTHIVARQPEVAAIADDLLAAREGVADFGHRPAVGVGTVEDGEQDVAGLDRRAIGLSNVPIDRAPGLAPRVERGELRDPVDLVLWREATGSRISTPGPANFFLTEASAMRPSSKSRAIWRDRCASSRFLFFAPAADREGQARSMRPCILFCRMVFDRKSRKFEPGRLRPSGRDSKFGRIDVPQRAWQSSACGSGTEFAKYRSIEKKGPRESGSARSVAGAVS